MPFSRSRSPESMARSSTCWCSPKAPPCQSIASTRVVLPWSTCATIATLRRSVRFRVFSGMAGLSSLSAGGPRRHTGWSRGRPGRMTQRWDQAQSTGRGTFRPNRESGQGAVERRLDVQRRAREHRQLGVGLLDQQLELGAAEDHALAPASQSSSMTPTTVVREVSSDLPVHQLAVDDLVDRVVPCRGRAPRPRGRARRAARRRTAAASCTTCRAARPCRAPGPCRRRRRRRRGAGTGCRRRPRPGRRRCGRPSYTSAAGRRRRASTPARRRPARWRRRPTGRRAASSVSSWNSTLDSTRRAECSPPRRCSTPRLRSL